MPPGMSLRDLYERRIGEGRLLRDDAQEAALAVLEEADARLAERPERRRFLRRRKAPEGPMGAYLWGGVGRGKSMLMDLFHEAAPVPSRRVHFHAFMQEVHDGMREARMRGERDAVTPVADAVARDVRVLCFDEMQISDITDAMIVGRLFERLFDDGVHVVTTSNRPPVDLYKDGLNRQLFEPFIAMLEARLAVHHLDSPRDHRQDRLRGEDAWFSPDRTAELDAIWERLTHGREEALTLRVKGREIPLARHANGVARVTFKEMCGRPLGAADYLALARAVRVLVLTDVPVLDRAHHNEARRFVTLIDALYEARTRVIVQAAAEPEGLYPAGTGAFEFARTASRLEEMRSEGWGAAEGPN
jgi:cell division protein ZapE